MKQRICWAISDNLPSCVGAGRELILELKSQQIVNADALVLGGGAGLSAAIKAGKHGVGVLQVFERVRKAVNDMVKDCQVTSGHFV